jgi:prepilin-type N-terminal cleavage/methylation domain-containing protein
MTGKRGITGAGRGACKPMRACSVHSATPASRRGLTLVELLITMVIMAIITAATLGTVSAALESARRSRTRSTIHKINTLVMERLESYSTRRVDPKQAYVNSIKVLLQNGTINSVQFGQMMADLRLLALREMMKYEMPDVWTDVTDTPVVLATAPPLTNTYVRFASNPGNEDSAKCLYQIVMNATGDGEARTLFTKQEIGLVDNVPVFLDGWGQPVRWMRWPAGFIPQSQVMTGDANADHDPFDAYRRDQLPIPTTPQPLVTNYPSVVQPLVNELRDNTAAFRLVPLIYSVGPDGISGVFSDDTPNSKLDPYGYSNDISTLQQGAVIDDKTQPINPSNAKNSKDNIHNHLLEK